MMLFWLVLAITIACFLIGHLKDIWEFEFLGALGAFVTLVMVIIMAMQLITAPGDYSSNQQRYEALIYKAETEAVRDEFGIMNKEYIDEVQEWNEDLAFNQAMQDDFWIGIFIPNFYDDFEFIDLEQFAVRG